MTEDDIAKTIVSIESIDRNGEVIHAISSLDELRRANPNNQQIEFARAQLFSLHIQREYALQEVSLYRAAFPKDLNGPLLSARVVFDSGEPSMALRILAESEESVGLSQAGRLLKVKCLMALRRTEEARAFVANWAISQDKSLHFIWANELVHEATTEKDLFAFITKARDLGWDPLGLEEYALGWYMKHGLEEKTTAVLQSALLRFPDAPKLNQLMARQEFIVGHEAEAVARLNQIVYRDPFNLEIVRWLSHYYLRKLWFRQYIRIFRLHCNALKQVGLGPR